MPAGDEYYAWGSTLAAFARSSSGAVESTAVAAAYDAAQCNNSLLVPAGAWLDSMPFVEAASATTFWLRFSLYFGAASGNAVDLVYLYNSAGAPVVRLRISATNLVNVLISRWNGAAWVDATNSLTLLGATRYDMAIRVACGVGGEVEWFIGGSSFSLLTGLTAAVNNIAAFRLIGHAPATHYSVICATNFDNRGLLYRAPVLNALGAYTNGTGAVGDVNEAVLDVTTFANLPAVGNKRSFTKAAIAVPAGHYIDRAVLAGLGRVAAPAADGRLGYKSGASDGLSANRGFTRGNGPRGAALAVDPATGVAFTQAGYNAAEPFAQAA